jgi:hypothetical protein
LADLKITELQALAGANLAATDELAVADISASETKKITVSDLIAFGADLISNAEIPSAKISFASGSIVEASLATGSVTATKIGADAVTAAKLGDQSTCIVAASTAALQAITGDFVGQLGFTTDALKIYLWQNSTWNAVEAAGSINTITADTSGIVNITVSTSGDTATVGTSLDNTGAAGQFLAGPTGSAGAVSYRTIAGADLPTATTSAKGGVIINGGGLTLSGDTAIINNTVTPVSDQLRKVSYNAQGLITASTSVAGGDLPVATSSVVGAVRPGTGLSVDGSGVLNHTNSVAGTTQNGITFDAQGHITNATALIAGDIPDLPATKLTSGTLDISRVGNNTVTGIKLANYAITKIGEVQPTPDQIGQFFFNPLTRDLFLWDGNVFQPIGISVGEIIFAGTFDASAGSGSGLIATVTAEGTAIGLVVGQPLPSAATANNRYYLVVSEAGTITSGNAPNVALAPPDIVLSNGNQWTEVDVSQTITSVTANQVSYTPSGGLASVNVQAALDELESEKLAKAGGTMTGELLIGSAGSFAFEGSTANAYETYLTAADPTADRTITFPDQSGNVIVSGNASIVNADINASAAIADTKLATISTANKVGIGAIDIDGGTDIGAALADADLFLVDDGGAGTNRKAAATRITDYAFGKVSGDITIGSTGTAAIASGVIVNADVNASAAIAGTKISPDFGSQTITTTGIISAALGAAATPSIAFTGDTNTGIYSPGADQVAISTNGTGRVFVSSAGALAINEGLGAGIVPGGHAIHVASDGASLTDISHVRAGDSAGAPSYNLRKSRGTIASPTITSNGDAVGNIFFTAHDGTGFRPTAAIQAFTDGVVSANSTPGRITFSTSPNGGVSYTERMRLDSTGRLGLGTSSPSYTLQVQGSVGIGTVGTAGTYNLIWAPNTLAQQVKWIRNNSGELSIGAGATPGTTEQFRIDDQGRVGIGTTSPVAPLHVANAVPTLVLDETDGTSTHAQNWLVRNANAFEIQTRTSAGVFAGIDYAIPSSTSGATAHIWSIANSERARIDSSGRLLVGTSTAFAGTGAITDLVQVNGAFAVRAYSANQFGNRIQFTKSRNATTGSHTVVQSGDVLGYLEWAGSDGTDFDLAARITAEVDGTPGADDMPGRLVFSTTADGASSPTERMRIAANGVVTIQNGAVAVIGTLTDGATITPDLAADCNFTVTLGGNRTIANPTNITAGQSGSIFIVQDATGGRTASWGSFWDFPGGTAPTLSTAANAVDRVDYIVRSSTSIHTVFTANYS